MNKHHYLYLLAWIDGSDSAGGERTKVRKQKDLMPQFKKHNENVFAIAIMNCPSEDLASVIGDSEAFKNNYTAHDSLSVVVEIDENHRAFFSHYKVIDVREDFNCKAE